MNKVAMSTTRRAVLGTGLAGVTAAALAACSKDTSTASASGPAGGGKKGTLIWATHVYYNQPALVGVSVGFRDFLDNVGWTFKVTAAKTAGDTQQTLQAQAQALALKPDAIVATMQDATSYNSSLQKIRDAGIYLEINNTQPDQGNGLGLPFIGQSFRNAGQAAVELVLQKAKANGKTSGPVLLGYCCGNAGAVGTRTAGQLAGVKAFNQANGTNFTTTTLLDTSDSDPASAKGTWQAKLSAVGNEIVGIVCDQVGNPSIDAAKALGKKAGFVPIVTFDVTSDRLDLVDQGWFTGVVDQQPYAQGYVAAAQAWMYITSKTVPVELYDTGSAIIQKSGTGAARAGASYITARAKALKIAS